MMLIPEKCYVERGHTGGRLVCEENRRRIVFLKPPDCRADKIRLDGCVALPGKACDYLVRDWQGRLHFVELKGKDVDHALKQMEEILPHFVTSSTGTFWCFVICSGAPPNSLPGTQSSRKRLRTAWRNLELVIKTNQHEHRLTE